MIQLSERTRRGLADAIGIPSVFGVLTLVLLVLIGFIGAAT